MKKFFLVFNFIMLYNQPVFSQSIFNYSWGYNGDGRLGGSLNSQENTPYFLDSSIKWKQISCGQHHVLAIKDDGSLWSWGYNNNGQLGLNSRTSTSTPTQIGTDKNWSFISAGGYHSCGIKANGTIWAWGWNISGELGIGNTNLTSIPTMVGNDSNWSKVSCGDNFTIAIKINGSLWSWGSNANGELGIGSTSNELSPKQVGASTNWLEIECGSNHSLAIDKNKDIWAWGNNNNGQLGDSTNNNCSSPKKIVSNISWKTISAGNGFSLGISENNSSYSWGDNNYGQLANGTNLSVNFPKKTLLNGACLNLSAGLEHSLFLNSKGELFSSGRNHYGQLGIGNTNNQSTPKKILNKFYWGVFSAGNSFNIATRVKLDTCYWNGNGNWFRDTINWSSNRKPKNKCIVIIKSGTLSVDDLIEDFNVVITQNSILKLTNNVQSRELHIDNGTIDLNGYRLTVIGGIYQSIDSSNYYIQAGTSASTKPKSELLFKPSTQQNSTIFFNPSANKINLLEIGNGSASAQITLGNALKIKGGEDGGSGPGLLKINNNGKIIIPSGGSLTLESDTFNAALSLSQPAQRSIICTGTGKFNIERDHYGVRGWRLYSHPFKTDIDLQEVANDIELIGAGGTAEGFYSDNYKNGAAYWYDYSKADSSAATDPAWTAFTSAKGTTVSGNANKWKKNSTMLLFNPGNQRGTDAFGSPSTATYVQGKITLSYALDSVTAIQLNDGKTQTITTGTLPSKSKYFFITNPYTAPVKLCRIHGLNLTNVDPYFYYWKQRRNTVTNNFSPAEWQAEKIFNGTALRDSNIAIPAFGTILVRLKNSGSTTFTIHEGSKQLSNFSYIIGGAKSVSKTGLMFVDATGSDIGSNGVEIKLLVNDSQEADRVLVYNEANQSAAYTTYDAAKYTNTDFPNIYTMSADAKPLAIDMQDIKSQLDAGKTEVIIPITIKREANKRYASLKMELSANTTGMEISLKDNQSKSVEPWFTGNLKNVQFAGADAEINRYSLVFKQNTTSVKDLLKDITNNKNNASKSELMVYPNPTDGKISLKLVNGDNYQGNYQIFDMTGRLLMEGKSQKTQIDASKLSSGQYIIKTKSQVSIFNKN